MWISGVFFHLGVQVVRKSWKPLSVLTYFDCRSRVFPEELSGPLSLRSDFLSIQLGEFQKKFKWTNNVLVLALWVGILMVRNWQILRIFLIFSKTEVQYRNQRLGLLVLSRSQATISNLENSVIEIFWTLIVQVESSLFETSKKFMFWQITSPLSCPYRKLCLKSHYRSESEVFCLWKRFRNRK